MLSNLRPSVVLGGWMALLGTIVAVRIAIGADISTTALLLAFALLPGLVTALLARGLLSPSVAEILHSLDSKDARS